jgi:hypothetical protein
MSATSISSGWSGTSASVKARFTNSGDNDKLTVTDTSRTQLALGTIAPGRNCVSATVQFAATMTRSADGTAITLALEAPDLPSRVNTVATGRNMTWAPIAALTPTGLAGNGLSTTSWTETGADVDF